MHYIQKHILDELRIADSLRYAQLNSIDVESGHFRYHLTQLISVGYIRQLGRGLYGLTDTGQRYVDQLSEHTVNPAHMPKVITYTLLRYGESVLLQKKTKQPYKNLLNMVGGKLHEGETAQEAAIREVYEKTGNVIEPPKLVGVFEIIITKEDTLTSHAIAYVFISHVMAHDYVQDSIKIVSIDKLLAAPNMAPDFSPIFSKIQDAAGICVETLSIAM